MKGLLIFILILALAVILSVWAGWLRFESKDQPDRTDVGVSLDKEEVRKDVDAWQRDAKDTVDDLRDGTTDKERTDKAKAPKDISLETQRIELNVGTAARIKVSRTGTDLPPAQLKLSSTPDSNLIVTGGEFPEGQRETMVTIEAPVSANGGRVFLQLDSGDREAITVDIIQPVSMDLPAENTSVRF